MKETEFPADGPGTARMLFLLEYAVLASSSHNTQPWRFAVGEDWITLFADTGRQLRVADPDRRELFLSVGCALENLIIAGEHFGYHPSVAYEGSDAGAEPLIPTATVRFSATRAPGPQPEYDPLFAAIQRRRTPHAPFSDREVPPSLVRDLEAAAERLEARLVLVDDPETRRKAAALAAEAERAQFSRPEFRHELADLVGQGAFGARRAFAWLQALAVSHLDLGGRFARRAEDQVSRAPLLGFLMAAVPTVGVPAWESREALIRAGRAYQRFALLAASRGHAAHPVSEPIQVDSTRGRLAALIGEPPEHLLMFFRVGEPTALPMRHTPRRPVPRVLASTPA